MNYDLAIERRRSVRTYTGEPLAAGVVALLTDAIKNAPRPFGGDITLGLGRFDIKGPHKPGTYGMISGACDYMLAAFDERPESALSTGYALEDVVLRATDAGIGTCWIGGTFKGSDFAAALDCPAPQSLKLIIAMGYPAGKARFLERVGRKIMGSSGRKPFEELFFKKNAETPLERDNTFADALSMMRLAPSSMNSQPWRAIVEGGTVHFYTVAKGPFRFVDLGIGLRHFAAHEENVGHSGSFMKLTAVPEAPKGHEYVISYRK